MQFATRAGMAALALFAGTAPQQQAPVKIGYVNVAVLLDKAPAKQAAESTFVKERNAAQVQLKAMSDSLQKEIDRFEADAPRLTPAQKTTREKALQDKQLDLQAKSVELQGRLQNREAELMRPIEAAVKEVLEQLRTDDGYTMIIAADAVIASDKNLDITEKAVLKLVQRPNTTVRRDTTVKPGGPPAQR
jgi:outer membrane protein